MADILVIIPAAGSGSRFGSELPKQFHQLGGKPVLQHVIERFLLDGTASRVVVAVSEQLLGGVKNTDRVQFVAGGATRQESVARALTIATDEELVAVHDAVRPFFAIETFHAVLAAARESGAALPALPVTDTIHAVDGDAIRETLDRSTLVAAQTPQAFRTEILRDVLQRATREAVTGTDEAGLAARYGHTVRVVPGDPLNIKITRPEDLTLAETLYQKWSGQ